MPAASPHHQRAADLLVACLEAEGCEYVFSVPGEETLDILDALSRSDRVRHVTTLHEQGAAFMADVYGRLTGRAAVAMATLLGASFAAPSITTARRSWTSRSTTARTSA